MKKINVFITVDTEHSIGGAFRNPGLRPVGNGKRIFFPVGRRDYGIPLLMDIAEQYGIRIVFFLEVLNKYYFGERESAFVCEYILNRGHDVQLHLHPNWMNFTTETPEKRIFSDQMHSYSLKEQEEIIADGKYTLIKYGAPPPVAFRAGNYGADNRTLAALMKNGIPIDSSLNLAYLDKGCRIKGKGIMDAAPIAGILEFPVTNFLEPGLFGNERFRPFDINGAGASQMRNTLESVWRCGPRNITVLLHSFSFYKQLNDQYTHIRVLPMVIRRFKRLCAYLSEHSDRFRVMTFSTLFEKKQELLKEPVHVMPRSDIISTLRRHMEQAWDLFPIRKSLPFSRELFENKYGKRHPEKSANDKRGIK